MKRETKYFREMSSKLLLLGHFTGSNHADVLRKEEMLPQPAQQSPPCTCNSASVKVRAAAAISFQMILPLHS